MKVGEQIKVRVPAPPHATQRHGIGGETLWVEMLEAPDPDGRWSAKLLNEPLLIPAQWGDTVSVTTDFSREGWVHEVDVSPFVAVDLDEKREYVDGPDMSVSETLERLKGKGCACCGGPLHD